MCLFITVMLQLYFYIMGSIFWSTKNIFWSMYVFYMYCIGTPSHIQLFWVYCFTIDVWVLREHPLLHIWGEGRGSKQHHMHEAPWQEIAHTIFKNTPTPEYDRYLIIEKLDLHTAVSTIENNIHILIQSALV